MYSIKVFDHKSGNVLFKGNLKETLIWALANNEIDIIITLDKRTTPFEIIEKAWYNNFVYSDFITHEECKKRGGKSAFEAECSYLLKFDDDSIPLRVSEHEKRIFFFEPWSEPHGD